MTRNEHTPLMTVVVIAVALIGFAAFFVGFLVAPVALLLLLYLALTTSDRARRRHQHAAARDAAEQEPS
jgi:hypothetical protein